MLNHNQFATITVLSLLSYAVSATAAAPGCSGVDYSRSDYVAGPWARSVAMGDIDADGDLDLVVTHSGLSYHGDEGVRVLRNEGDGTYAEAEFYPAGKAPQSIELGDIDGDGDLDMVMADLGVYGSAWTDYGIIVMLNDGAGVFGSAIFHPLDNGYVEPRSAVLGDLDHDGDLDVVATVGYSSYLHSDIAVLINAGGGVFEAPQYFATGYGPVSVALGDLNGDGHLDAVTANYTSNGVTRLYGNGNGGFGAAVAGAGGQQPRKVILADVNNNGTPDIMVANHDGLIVSLDSGGGGFYSVGLRPSAIAAGDVDGDGDLDLVTANILSDTLSLLLNTGNGSFATAVTLPAGDAPGSTVMGDVDGNGSTDIVAANIFGGTVAVLRNDCGIVCPADIDGSGSVGIEDILSVLASWGSCSGCDADLDGNGQIDLSDLLQVLAAWGACR